MAADAGIQSQWPTSSPRRRGTRGDRRDHV